MKIFQRALAAIATVVFAIAGLAPAQAQTLPTPQQVFLNRFSTVLTTTPLPISGVYDSAWFDNAIAPVLRVNVESYANQASAAAGFIVQQSNDITNSNLTNTAASATCSASTLCTINANVQQRYWRVQYTNTTTAQTSFEIAVSSDQVIGANVDTLGNYTINQTLLNSVALGSPSAWGTAPAGNVQGNNDAVLTWGGSTALGSPTAVGTVGAGNVITTNSVVNASTVGGASSTLTQNLVGTVVSIKASAGTLYQIYAINNSGAACVIEAWNTASGSVTLGTTVPTQFLSLASGAYGTTLFPTDIGVAQSTAISIAAVTAFNGATGCATGVIATTIYK